MALDGSASLMILLADSTDLILRWPPQAALEGWPHAPSKRPRPSRRASRSSG